MRMKRWRHKHIALVIFYCDRKWFGIQSVRYLQAFVNGMKIGVFVMTYTDQQYLSRFFV